MNLLLGTFSSEKLEYISRCSVALKNVNLEQPKNSCLFSFKLIPKVTTPPPPQITSRPLKCPKSSVPQCKHCATSENATEY